MGLKSALRKGLKLWLSKITLIPTPPERVIDSVADLRAVLDQIGFNPSCVDMDWEWEIKVMAEAQALLPDRVVRDRKPAEGDPLMGWCIRTTFQRPDTETGEIGAGYGRWWFIPWKASETFVYFTACMAMDQILIHERLEATTYMGIRPVDPHNSILRLISASPKLPETR